MAYVNYEIMTLKGLSIWEVGILQLFKQNKIQDLSAEIKFEVEGSTFLEKMSNLGYIEVIKGTPKQTYYQKLRATKSGIDLLDLIGTPDIQNGDAEMYSYLCEMYMSEDSSRSLGNRKAGLRYCAQFRQIMGMTLHEMYWLCQYYVSNSTYTKVLEYIFLHRKEVPYGKFKDVYESSKLYMFWQDNEYEIRDFWAKKIKPEDE